MKIRPIMVQVLALLLCLLPEPIVGRDRDRERKRTLKGDADAQSGRNLWAALSGWLAWVFGQSKQDNDLDSQYREVFRGPHRPNQQRRYPSPRRARQQRRHHRSPLPPKTDGPPENDPPFSPAASSATLSRSNYLARKQPRRYVARRRGNRAPSHRRERKKELRRFLRYLETSGRRDEARLLRGEARAAKRHYSLPLRHWEEFMEWVEGELAALPARRQDPEYQPPGQDAQDEADSHWLGLCQCLHCRLQRKGFFRDDEGLEPTPVMKRMWAEYKRRLVAGNPFGCMPKYGREPDPNWQD